MRRAPWIAGGGVSEVPTGPGVAALVHRLGAAPADLADPAASMTALLSDLAHDLGTESLPPRERGDLDALCRDASSRTIAGLVWWLGRDPAVAVGLGLGEPGALVTLVRSVATDLGALHAGTHWQGEGREELARAVLRARGRVPAGETGQDAEDRWRTVSTRIQRETMIAMAAERAAAEELARALERKRAQEAAAQYANY